MGELLNSLLELLGALLQLGRVVLHLLLVWSLVIAWAAWWLRGVNWVRAWPVLAQGAWVPVLLLIVLAALVWSQIAPAPLELGFMSLPNFWWQLGAAALLAVATLLLGWLQGVMGWAPPEIAIYPEGGEHGHDHHGHEPH